MGGSGSKSKGFWPFSGSGSTDDPTKEGNEQSLTRGRSFPGATPFVFTRRRILKRLDNVCMENIYTHSHPSCVVDTRIGKEHKALLPLLAYHTRLNFQKAVYSQKDNCSMFFDEDGDLAHEFYEETIVTKNGRKKAKLKRIQKNLTPQGIIKLDHPCIHVDFPVVLCEA